MPHSLEFLHAAYVPKSFNLRSLVEIQGILRNVTCCWSLTHKSAHQIKIFNRGTCAQGLVLLIFTWAGSPGPWPGSGASCWCARFNQTEIKVWSWSSWYWWQLCPRSNGSGIWAWRNLIFMRDGRKPVAPVCGSMYVDSQSGFYAISYYAPKLLRVCVSWSKSPPDVVSQPVWLSVWLLMPRFCLVHPTLKPAQVTEGCASKIKPNFHWAHFRKRLR